MTSTYPIRAVAKLTGIPLETLRAWERRYEVVTPRRGSRGRVYTEKEVQRLILLRDAVARGHAISLVANLPDAKLRAMLEKSGTLTSATSSDTDDLPEAALAPLLHSFENYDYLAAERELARLAAATARPRDLVHQVVLPLMRVTGERWHQGAFSIAQEHMVTALLTGLLASLLRLYGAANPPARVLLATPENEHHGFGVLTAAMLTAAGGLGAIHLGTSLPAREIIQAARRTEADAILLGLGSVQADAVLPALREIRKRVSPRTQLWIGGAAELTKAAAECGWLALEDFHALEHWLELLGAKF